MESYKEIDLLVKNNKNEEALRLLYDIKRSKTLTVDEAGWMYWNISDITAVIRKPQKVYENHIEYVEWGKHALFPDKLHWFVSDATQALTLSINEYSDEWWGWYLFACEYSSKNEENRGIRFESHRAAARLLLTLERFAEMEVPLVNLLEVIEEDKDWENIVFAEFTYYTLLAEKAFNLNQVELCEKSAKLLGNLTNKIKNLINIVPDEKNQGMLGSWESLNCSRLNKDSLSTLLHNSACTFHKIGEYERSVETFQLALRNGVSITTYGMALFLSSLWKVNKNNREVLEVFTKYSPEGILVNELTKIDSDLTEIEWELLKE